MRIYVDELPKSCKECFFCEHIEEDIDGKGRDEVACYFEGFLNNVLLGDTFNSKNCKHLQSLAEHDKQVRKEVCDKIRAIFSEVYRECQSQRAMWDSFFSKLDQLQGE